MNLKKFLASGIGLLFLCGSMVIVAQPAFAKPPHAGPPGLENGMPPGLMKKQQEQEQFKQQEEEAEEEKAEEKDVEKDQEDTDQDATTQDETTQEYQHPSLKGLMNAYNNVKRNGASERAQQVLRQKIEARGGVIDEEEEEKEELEAALEVYGDLSTTLAAEESEDLAFVVKDQEGNAVELKDNWQIKLTVADGDNVLANLEDGEEIDLGAAESGDTGVTGTVTVTASAENEGTASIKAVLQAENENGEFEELATVDVTFTVVEELAATTASLVYSDEDISFVGSQEDNSILVAPTEKEINLSYELQDQGGEPFEVSEAVTVNWTIENKGDSEVTVTNDVYDEFTLKANDDTSDEDTVTFSTDIQDASSTNITLVTGSATELQVTADVEGEEGFEQSAGILFYPADNKLASNEDTAKVVTVTMKNDSDKDNVFDMLVEDDDGNCFYVPSSITFETVQLKSNDEDDAENASLQVGDTVLLQLDGNAESDEGDEDKLKELKW